MLDSAFRGGAWFGGVPGSGGGAWSGGVCSGGVSALGGICSEGEGFLLLGGLVRGVVSQHALRQTPPVNRMNDRQV